MSTLVTTAGKVAMLVTMMAQVALVEMMVTKPPRRWWWPSHQIQFGGLRLLSDNELGLLDSNSERGRFHSQGCWCRWWWWGKKCEIIDQYIALGNKAKQKPQKSESDKNQDWFQTFLCEKTSKVSAFTRKGLFEPAWLWESEEGFLIYKYRDL